MTASIKMLTLFGTDTQIPFSLHNFTTVEPLKAGAVKDPGARVYGAGGPIGGLLVQESAVAVSGYVQDWAKINNAALNQT